ncbi:MAG: 50S ribosomal protein L23 [Planctomycetes bacterium]|nr:50S ribosomal protein L23 [Planctomycetota bacterium]
MAVPDRSRYYRIIRVPHITEKVHQMVERNRQYAFVVDRGANKGEVKAAIEAIFDVKVAKVNVMNVAGKRVRVRAGKRFGYVERSDWKKALVKLQKGHQIDFI